MKKKKLFSVRLPLGFIYQCSHVSWLARGRGREYLNLSVRGLYKHVLAAIMSPLSAPKIQITETLKVDLQRAELSDVGPTDDSDEKPVTFEAGPHPTIPATNTGSPRHVPEEVKTEREGEVTYRERLGGYLHPRDMRRLVTPFSASNQPELIVRRHAILLNFDPLRAIILRDRLLVLVPEGADSILMRLEQRVRGGMDNTEMLFFGEPSEEELTEYGKSFPWKKRVASATTALVGKVMKTSVSSGSLDYGSIDQALKDSLHTGTKQVDKSSKTRISMPKTSLTKQVSGSSSKGTDEGWSSHNKKGKKRGKPGINIIPEISSTKKVPGPVSNDASDAISKTPFFDHGAEWEEMKSRDWIDLPFELQCVDAVLHVVGGILSDDTYLLQQAALAYIHDLLTGRRGALSDDPLLIIRHLKDSIREMGSRLRGFVQSIERVLGEDEDMALMNLSRLLSHPDRFIKPVSPQILEEESDEPELILEAGMQTGLTLTNALHLVQGQIDTASELVDQKLDSTRNKILFANMIISVFSLCVTSASLVGSLFGMNLHNGLEDDGNAFKQVTVGTVCGAFVMSGCIMAALVYSGTIPRIRLYGSAW
jgi:magnesium transporter